MNKEPTWLPHRHRRVASAETNPGNEVEINIGVTSLWTAGEERAVPDGVSSIVCQ